MEKRLTSFLLSIILGLSIAYSQKNYDETQKKLEKIKSEIELKSKEYDEYMKKYNQTMELVNKLKETEMDYHQKKKEYEKILSELKNKIEENRKQYNLLTQMQNSLKEETKLDIRKLYISRFSYPFFYGKDEIIKDIIKRNMIIEKKRFVDVLEGKKKVFKQSIFDLTKKDEEISKVKKQAEIMIEKNKKEIEKNEKELFITDARLKKLKEEIERLNRTAKELTTFIKNIEKKSPYKKTTETEIPIPKKSLPWPVIGKVISKFGKEYIDDLKTWIINDGIKIKTETNLLVKPVMKGKVAYSGKFRGYGNIVLIEHEDNIFTTYGFLSEIYVNSGDIVNEFSDIGRVGTDTRSLNDENSYVLYFEIRKGENPIDPLIYLK